MYDPAAISAVKPGCSESVKVVETIVELRVKLLLRSYQLTTPVAVSGTFTAR
jgi:hypothetical protein